MFNTGLASESFYIPSRTISNVPHVNSHTTRITDGLHRHVYPNYHCRGTCELGYEQISYTAAFQLLK